MRAQLFLLSIVQAAALQLQAAVHSVTQPTVARCGAVQLAGEGGDLGGAISGAFGELFAGMQKSQQAKQEEIDRAYAEQLEVLERRRNPEAYKAKLRATEERRAAEAEAFRDKFDWQRSADPL